MIVNAVSQARLSSAHLRVVAYNQHTSESGWGTYVCTATVRTFLWEVDDFSGFHLHAVFGLFSLQWRAFCTVSAANKEKGMER